MKPANVLMLPDGTAKITDFGLAKARGVTGEIPPTDRQRSILVSTGGMTPAYCSPEQANKQPLSRKTDIWSWAVSVLEAFAGEVSWQSGVAAPELLRHLAEVRMEGVALPQMPESLQELLQACFESDPARRPNDGSEISRRLAGIYRAQLDQDFLRPEPTTGQLRADALNNRGLSLLDLAKPAEALGMFEQALALEPAHPECLYNRGLLLWRQRKVTDQTLLTELREASTQPQKAVRCCYLMGLVHLERGDSVAAVKALEAAGSDGTASLEVKAALDRATGLARTSARVQTFEGHTDQVTSVAFSADGRWALSGSWDKTLKLWEVASSRCVRTFDGHTDSVNSVALTADGSWALSGSDDKTVRLWEVASGRCVRTFKGHASYVSSVALSADGRRALSGSRDNTLRLWELDWECEFPNAADWNEAARPYLDSFLTLHCPVGQDGFSRVGKPMWTEEDFQNLLTGLQYRGYGWLRPEGVRRQLLKMTEEWQGPPPLAGA